MSEFRDYDGRSMCAKENMLRVFGDGGVAYAAALRVLNPGGLRGSMDACLTGAQVDDLIEQLCAIRGHQSPIEPPCRTIIREEKIAVPRFVRFRPTGNSDDLLLWKDASGQLRGWYVTSSVKEPWPGGADSRHGTVKGWDAEPCSTSLLDPKDPAYLRAVADLLDGKGTTTVTRPVTVFERVAVPGVSGRDFRSKGGAK